MKTICLVLALVGAFGLFGCAEPTGSGLPGPDSLFTIDRLEADTLYWGETAKLLGSSFGTDPKRIKIFQGTTKLEVIQVTEDFLYFNVGTASSGALRVYKDDHLAKGSVSITIIPHADGMPMRLEGLAPSSGVPGDRFVVLGENLDIRLRDIAVRLGKQSVAIDSATKYAIYCRVPANAVTSEVTVLYDHRVRPVGQFIVAPARMGEVSAGSFNSLTLRFVIPVMLSLTYGSGEGTLIDTSWLDDSLFISLGSNADVSSGIRVTTRSISSNDTVDLTIDLSRVNGKYAGQIRIDAVRPHYGELRYHSMIFKLEDATLRPTKNGLGFLCAAPINPGEISLQDYEDVIDSYGSVAKYEMIEPWPFVAQGEAIPLIRMEFK